MIAATIRVKLISTNNGKRIVPQFTIDYPPMSFSNIQDDDIYCIECEQSVLDLITANPDYEVIG